jgi:endonuclease VIII
MTGAWKVLPAGSTQWPRSPRRAWLVLRRGEWQVVEFDGPVLELMTEARTRFDRLLSQLGPDVLAPELDESKFLQRLREDDPTRAIGDTLLDQHVLAGLGTIWRSEGCWLARLDPFRPTGQVTDEEALAVARLVRPPMQDSARNGFQERHRRIYGRAGLPCPRCGPPAEIRRATQGDDNRRLYWCPSCQT